MKITVEFNSLDEISEFQKIYVAGNNIIGEFISEEVKKQLGSSATPAEKPKKPAKKTKAEPAPEEAPEEVEEPAEEAPEAEEAAEESTEQEHSDTDLKMLLSGKLKAGKKAEVKELFTKYGVNCLTDLIKKNPDKLDAIYAEAEEI